MSTNKPDAYHALTMATAELQHADAVLKLSEAVTNLAKLGEFELMNQVREDLQKLLPPLPAVKEDEHLKSNWAEDLIRQLPADHEGRNSWLLNYSNRVEPEVNCAEALDEKADLIEALEKLGMKVVFWDGRSL